MSDFFLKHCKKQELEQVLVHWCSLQHYSQGPKRRNNPSADERINKIEYIYTTEYYSATKRKVTTWMNPQNMMLSKRCQSQKDKYCMISPYMGHINKQIQRQRVD